MAQKRITDLAPASAMTGSELFEVSQLSEDVTISADTINANAADNSFTDTGAGFVAAGFVVGDRVRVSGFATAANNLNVGTLTAVAADKITIGGEDGDVIVDEAEGEDVTITKWTTRRASADDIMTLARTIPSTVKSEVADYTVDPEDAQSYIRLTGNGTKDVTVEPDGTTPLPTNGEWHFRNVGLGDATFVEGAGVTINVPNGGSLVVPQGGTVTLKRVAANVFDLLGQTVAEA